MEGNELSFKYREYLQVFIKCLLHAWHYSKYSACKDLFILTARKEATAILVLLHKHGDRPKVTQLIADRSEKYGEGVSAWEV